MPVSRPWNARYRLAHRRDRARRPGTRGRFNVRAIVTADHVVSLVAGRGWCLAGRHTDRV